VQPCEPAGDQGAATRPVLRLQVTSPRRPCSNVDKTKTATYTKHGIRAHCARTGDGGVFFRGRPRRHPTLAVGQIVREARPPAAR
jgi:hypothetical protein